MNSNATWSAQLQPRYASDFRCLGADCEDTCCYGWRVGIDKETYDKYQQCSDPDLRSSFNNLISIDTGNSHRNDYASLNLSESGCAFLSERLCSIQAKLGESYLPKTCATYPRNLNLVGDVLETTLDLSCPEAARLALSSPSATELIETPGRQAVPLPEGLILPEREDAVLPHPAFGEIREFIVGLLQNRTYPLWQRLKVLGYFCEDVDKFTAAIADRELPSVVEQYRQALKTGLFEQSPNEPPANAATQLEIVLELILDRIGSDFTSRRFLDCYQQFMQGVQWTMQSTIDDLGRNYAEAHATYYGPVVSENEHILENYLVNYVCKNLFPFGTKAVTQKLGLNDSTNPAFLQYMLMASHFAVVHTIAVGMAGFHKEAFNTDLLLKIIQTSTKTFEHSITHPRRVLEILASKHIQCPADLPVIFADVRTPAADYAIIKQ